MASEDVEGVRDIGAFEVHRAARERYQEMARRSMTIPSGWDLYLAGFKAGGVFVAHTSGRLSDPEVRLAIRILAEVLCIERGDG